MAGAFGEDMNFYNEDESEDDEELDENLEDEEYEDEEEDQEEEDLAEEAETAQASKAEQKKAKEADKKSVENRLKKILRIAPNRAYPHLTINERIIVNRAKKTHPALVKMIKDTIKLRRSAKNVRFTSILGGSTPVIIIVGMVVVVLLAVAISLSSIFGGDDGTGGGSSPFGISGRDYYGARFIYTDADRANTDIVSDYVSIIGGAIDRAETNMSTLDITISVPTEYDYDHFSLSEFSSSYPDLYAILVGMIDEVYAYDNADSTEPATEFFDKVSAIKYFGLNTQLSNEIAPIIYEYINDNNLYTVTVDGSAQSGENADAEQTITDSTTAYLSESQFSIRTEKYYIKDYILDSADSRLVNVESENYVAMIFMPKNAVTISYTSLAISGVTDDFQISLYHDAQTIGLSELDLTGLVSNGVVYETSRSLSVATNAFTAINVDNLEYLAEGMSLFDILNDLGRDNAYLTADTTDGTESEILTYATSGVYAQFESSSPFAVYDYETIWS